jgi:ureidoacrylate peracid hydrolase
MGSLELQAACFVGTNLDLILRSNGIENLIVTGVATNICVDSTARDGYMRDYRVTVLEDCCGTYDKALHDATWRTSSAHSALWRLRARSWPRRPEG